MRAALLFFLAVCPAVAGAQPGALDPSFGAGGLVTYQPGPPSYLYDVAVDSEGVSTAVGMGLTETDSYGIVVRFREDGSLDPAFGEGGTRTVLPGGGARSLSLSSVAALGGGRMALVGLEASTDFSRGVAVRLDGDALDPTYGVGGVARLPNGTFPQTALPLPDGRLVVTGTRNAPAPACFAARFTAAGALDPTFGVGGIAVVPAPAGFFNEVCDGGALALDGRVLLGGGMIQDGGGSAALLIALTSSGALDPTFSGDGVAVVPLCTGPCIVNGSARLSVTPDGRPTLSGTLSLETGQQQPFVLRLEPDGDTDTSFGSGGVAWYPTSGTEMLFSDLALQPDGHVIIVGYQRVPNWETDLLVARLLPDGSPDASFGDPLLPGTPGRALIHAGALDLGWAVALMPDGRSLIIGGTYHPVRGETAVIARVLGDAAVSSEGGPEGDGLALHVAPHPVRGAGVLTLEVSEPAGSVRLALYDARGREVARLHTGPLGAGSHAFSLPVGPLAPGLYVARVDGPDTRASLRLVVVQG